MANDTLVNTQAAQLASQVANWAAQLEFQKTRFQLLEMPQFQSQDAVARGQLQLQIDQLAWQKAEAAYKRALEEASTTGMYNGVPTIQWLTQQAQLTGVLNGQQTLQGAMNAAQIAQMQHAMELESKQFELNYQKFGFDQTKWTAEFGQQQTNDLRNYLLSEAGVTGTFNGQDTLAKQQLNQQGALGYLNLLASVQGNPFKMLKVQQGAGNFNNLAQGLLGKYEMAGAGGVTGNPGSVGVSDLITQYHPDGTVTTLPASAVNPAAGMTYSPGAGAPVAAPIVQTGGLGAAGYVTNASPTAAVSPANQAPLEGTGYLYTPPGVQAPAHNYNYETTPSGQTQVYPPGITAPVQGSQYSTITPRTPTTPGATGAEGSTTRQSNDVLTPNKISGENYANANAGEQKLAWQYLVDQGWDEDTAKSIFQKSLPRYGGPAAGKVSRAA